MADKLSVAALREVGPMEGASPKLLERILDKYTPNIAKRVQAETKDSIYRALGVQRLEDASQIAQLRQERDARPTPEAHAYAKKAARNMGLLIGACIGLAVATTVGGAWVLLGTRSGMEGAAWGAMIGAQRDNEQTLRDLDTGEHGRVPLPGAP